MTFKDFDPFWVQTSPRGMWHIETLEDPEEMLCGLVVSVESTTAKVQSRPGLKKCLWCVHAYEKLVDGS